MVASTLTAWTIKGRPSSLDDATDSAGFSEIAFATQAWFAFAIIDREAVLKIPELARGLPVIAQRRAPRRNRFFENRFDRLH